MCAMDQKPTTIELDQYLDALDRAGSYRCVRALGNGGGAGETDLVVFRGAGSASLGPFVRKRIPRDADLGGAYELICEAQRAGRRFIHLPRIVECYRTEADLTVVSEFVPGETLAELVAGGTERACGGDGGEGPRPGVELAARVFPALCDAVEELHGIAEPPIIHRDLKPSNVIVAPEGLFLIDLGIARRWREGADGDTVRFGTRAYAPPEQYGFGQTDVRSDVFALGSILVFCLTGEDPSPDLDAVALEGDFGSVARVAARARAFDPAERYPSAAALGDAFLAAMPARLRDGADGDGKAGMREHPSQGSPAARASAPGPALPAAPVPDTWGERRDRGLLAGRIWNAFLVSAGILFLLAAIDSLGHPAPDLAGKPLWYQAAIGFAFALPLVWGALYLVADKRDLYRLVPALAGRRLADDLKVMGIYLLTVFLALVVASGIAGV